MIRSYISNTEETGPTVDEMKTDNYNHKKILYKFILSGAFQTVGHSLQAICLFFSKWLVSTARKPEHVLLSAAAVKVSAGGRDLCLRTCRILKNKLLLLNGENS